MKKRPINITALRIALMISLAMISYACDKDDSYDQMADSDSNIITFSPSIVNTSVETKASLMYYDETSSSNNNFTEFGVYGYEVAANDTQTILNTVFDYKKVYLSSSVWTYDTPIYWLSTNQLSVMAFAPYTTTNTGLTISSPTVADELTIEYKIPTAVASQPDLMVATCAATSDVGIDIPLKFDHMLSAVTFSLSGSPTAKVESIIISGVSSEATLTVGADTNQTRTWSNLSAVSGNSDEFKAVLNNNTTPTSGSTNSMVDTDGYMMMIPQNHSIYSQIEIKITSLDNNQAITKYIPLSGSEWLSGKIYDYEIVLDGVEFSFNVSVKDWDSVDHEYSYSAGVDTGIDPDYWINLNAYPTATELTQAVTNNLSSNITELIVMGDYYTGCLGSSTTSTSPLVASGVEIIDMSRIDNFPTDLPNYAFYTTNSPLLETITIPSDVTTIGAYAFSGCSSLTSIELIEAVSIGNYAFQECRSLTTIELPKAATIGRSAFINCSSLSRIELPSATSVGYQTFRFLATGANIYLTADNNNTINVTYASESWSSYNLYLHESATIDSTFIVKSTSAVKLTYGTDYKFNSVSFVDDNGNVTYTLVYNGSTYIKTPVI